MSRPIQYLFVANKSDPTQPSSPDSRKSTHSHVMRQAHARKRRLQTQKYQKESNNGSSGLNHDVAFLKETVVLSNPFSDSINYTIGKDPFSSLARPLTSDEYFLLDHCMLIPRLRGHIFSSFLKLVPSQVILNTLDAQISK